MRYLSSLLLLLLAAFGLTSGRAITGSPNQASSSLTNAEKMSRGMPLNPPSRLYDNKRAIRPRASPASFYANMKAYRSSDNSFMGYLTFNNGYFIASDATKALVVNVPDTSGTYAQLTAPATGSSGNQYYGLSVDTSLSTSSQPVYVSNNQASDGGSPTANTQFQSSVFSWSSKTSTVTHTVVGSSGRTSVTAMMSGYGYFRFSSSSINDYPTPIYFVFSPV